MDDWRWLETGNWFRIESSAASLGTGSGRVSVSGADFLRGRSLGTERDSGASVHIGVDGALAGPVRAQEDKAVSLMEIDGERPNLMVGGLLDGTLKLSHLIHCHVWKEIL